MASGKWLTRPPDQTALFKTVGAPANLTGGNHWLGFEYKVLERNTRAVDKSTAYQDARRRQSDAYAALIDARMRIAQKLAELADLPERIADEQRARVHQRYISEHKRALERLQTDYDRRMAIARSEAELARLNEIGVRAERNFEAARSVKQSEIDRWYAEAEARKNNALAERQDTAADLDQDHIHRAPAADAVAARRAQDLNVLDHQIELERQRGNEGAVMALMTLRARLRGA